MKNFEQKFGVIIFGILLSLSLSTLLVSCDEDDDPNSNNSTTVSNNTVFTLYILSTSTGGELVYNANFSTNLLTVVPTVTINNVMMTDFYNFGGSLGYFLDLPHTQVYNFSVSGGGNATSGTINLPEFISSFTCNGTILSEEEMTQINVSNEYIVNWQTVPCDYQIFYAYDGSNQIKVELENDISSYTLTAQDIGSSTFSVAIYAFNGIKYTPGATPNVSGDYGKGYIISESQSLRWIHIGTSAASQLKTIVPKELSHETKLKILMDRLDRELQ